MKEQLIQPQVKIEAAKSHTVEPVRLTIPGRITYAKSGDIFMPDITTPDIVTAQPEAPKAQPQPELMQAGGMEKPGPDPVQIKLDEMRVNAGERLNAQQAVMQEKLDPSIIVPKPISEDSDSLEGFAKGLEPWMRRYEAIEDPKEREDFTTMARNLVKKPIEEWSDEELAESQEQLLEMLPSDAGGYSLDQQNIAFNALPLMYIYDQELSRRTGNSDLSILAGLASMEKELRDSGLLVDYAKDPAANLPSDQRPEAHIKIAERPEDQAAREAVIAKNSSPEDAKDVVVTAQVTESGIPEVIEKEAGAETESEPGTLDQHTEIKLFSLDKDDLKRLDEGRRNFSTQSESLRLLANRLAQMSDLDMKLAGDAVRQHLQAIMLQLQDPRAIPTPPAYNLPRLEGHENTEQYEAVMKERERRIRVEAQEKESFYQNHDLTNANDEIHGLTIVASKLIGELDLRTRQETVKLAIDGEGRELTRSEQMEIAIERQLQPIRDAHVEIKRILDEERGVGRASGEHPPGVQSELNRNYAAIETVIEGLDYESGETGEILKRLAKISIGEDGTGSLEGYEHYGLAVEYALEFNYNKGDLNATAEFPQPGFYGGINIAQMIEELRPHNEGLYLYLVNLRGKRQLVHELFRNLKDRKTFVEYTTRALDVGGLQFVEDQVGGVPQIQAMYEEELGLRTAMRSLQGKGWLQSGKNGDYEKADEAIEARAISESTIMQRDIPNWERDSQTKRFVRKPIGQRLMREWERRRAFNMGRAMTAASERRLTYTIFGDIPTGASHADMVKSVEAEPITSIMGILKMDAIRWKGQMAAQNFMDHLWEVKREQAARKHRQHHVVEVVDPENPGGDKLKKGFFGTSEVATIALDTGIHDVKSSWWRQGLMFFEQEDYKFNSSEGPVTIAQFFDNLNAKMQKEHKASSSKKAQDHISYGHKSKHDIRHEMDHHEHGHGHTENAQAVVDFLSQQRLFLGALINRPDLGTNSRELLWHKVSDLLPSRMATLAPHPALDNVKRITGITDETLAHAEMEKVMRKLFNVEQDRIQEDAKGLMVASPGAVAYQTHELGHYYNEYNSRINRLLESLPDGDPRHEVISAQLISEQEWEIVQSWQQLGHAVSGDLARSISDNVLFLNDVPRTAWNQAGRTDMDRILVGDQSGLAESYMGLIGIIANPAQKAEKVLEPMHGFVHTVQNIFDLEASQGYVEPFLVSYIRMTRQRTEADWIPFRKAILRKGNSEVEDTNMSANISYGPGEIAEILQTAAQQEIIADDLAETERLARFKVLDKIVERPGFKKFNEKLPWITKHILYKDATQLQRIAKEEDADSNKSMRSKARLFLLIFGAILPLEVLKAILPDEVSKNV